MAVISYLTTKTTAAGVNAAKAVSGLKEAGLQNTVTVGATDTATSSYLMFQDVNIFSRFKELFIENDALGGAAAISITLANPKTGVVYGAALLASALSVVAAHKKGFDGTAANLALDGLAALSHEQTLQSLYELCGLTAAQAAQIGFVDVIVTLGVAGGSGGKITGRGTILPIG